MTNIAISGWSGVGSTTITLILALLLKRKYVYIGSVFRYLGEKLGYENEGLSRIKADRALEREIGVVMDKYVDFVLLNKQRIILESDLSAFRIGKVESVFSVFLKAGLAQRALRAIGDSRGEAAGEILAQRDAEHKNLYRQLWKIDYFDEQLIRDKYWEIIDTGDLSIEQTIEEVLVRMERFGNLSEEYDYVQLKTKIGQACGVFYAQGKKGLRLELEKQGLLLGQKDILAEIAKSFMQEAEDISDEIKNIIISNEPSQSL